jgi:hypothetical protein
LLDLHIMLHVSQLKKCLHVLEEQIPMADLDAKEDLSYQEYPVKILGISERVTQSKKIKMCKVQWSHHTDELKAKFPSFFSDLSESRGRDSF